MSEDRLLTASEVAEILHVKLSWVGEATREGRASRTSPSAATGAINVRRSLGSSTSSVVALVPDTPGADLHCPGI